MTGFDAIGWNAKAVLNAMNRSQAVIELDMDGTILNANANFCSVLGYDMSEIVGRHHRMFVAAAAVHSTRNKDFCAKLAQGQFDQGQYKRITKGGAEVWIEASYNPVLRGGKP